MGSAPQRLGDLSLAAILVWFAGVMMGVFGGATLLQSLRCGSSPAEISCARLSWFGPPGSHYVSLTEYSPNWEAAQWYTNDEGRYKHVLVPLWDNRQAVTNVVAKLYWPENQEAARQTLAQRAVSGLIEQRGLDADSAANLTRAVRGLDPDKCWVFSAGKEPYDVKWMGLVFLAGIGLHTASLFLFARPRPAGRESQVTSMMIPLLALVDGLHELANRLPLSRRMWGVLLMPPAIAVAGYGAYLFCQLALGNEGATEAGDLLSSFLVVVGSSFCILALAFLVTKAPEAPTMQPTPAVPRGFEPDRRAGF